MHFLLVQSMHFDSAMEPHCLSILFSLSLMLMTAHGAIPPELYWKMMLPTTPVPKAITELLNLGEDVVSRSGKSVDAETQPQSSFRLFVGSKEIPSQDVRPFFSTAKETQSLDEKTKTGLFFFEDALHRGNKLNVQFSKIRNPASVPILPREIAGQIPFSLDKTKEALQVFSVKPDSKNAEIVEKTIAECQGAPPTEGEGQICATSLESVVDFAASKLGKNARAMSTEVEFEKESTPLNLLVKAGVKKLADDGVAGCHPLSYPYAVYLCHKLPKTSAYFVPLEGEDGVRVNAVAVCHQDTSKWDPNHVAFQELNVKPGTVPVCHVLPEKHLLWVPK